MSCEDRKATAGSLQIKMVRAAVPFELGTKRKAANEHEGFDFRIGSMHIVGVSIFHVYVYGQVFTKMTTESIQTYMSIPITAINM